jgi:hypothetical protein
MGHLQFGEQIHVWARGLPKILESSPLLLVLFLIMEYFTLHGLIQHNRSADH